MNKLCFDRILPLPTAARLAGVRSKQWVNGSTLRIKFMAGTASQQALVKQYAVEWCLYANLKFVFIQDPDAEIRIAFNENDGAWSYIGMDCLEIPRDQPTMNLGWVDKGVILHEFGHAIACIHEHQNPAGGIQWNKERVYADLGGPPNYWDKATVDNNIFARYSTDQINGTQVDPKSIMMYFFPATWTTDGFHTEQNEVLSEQDKLFIGSARMYPKAPAPVATAVIPVSTIHEASASISIPGEKDTFLVTVTEPGTYTIQTHGNMDCLMVLLGSNKTTLLARDDDSGTERNSMIIQSLQPGDYWVLIRHYSSVAVGDYRITVTRTVIG